MSASEFDESDDLIFFHAHLCAFGRQEQVGPPVVEGSTDRWIFFQEASEQRDQENISNYRALMPLDQAMSLV